MTSLGNSPVITPTAFDETATLIERQFGITRLACLVELPFATGADAPVLELNYPDEWVEHFIKERQFVQDPVITHARRATAAFDWSELDWTTPDARLVAGDAADFGIGTTGFAVPISMHGGGHACIAFGTDMAQPEWHRFLAERRTDLELIAYKLHQARLIGQSGDATARILNVSEREREVMLWVGEGKSDEDAATIMGITERTVRAHLISARKKLDATNRTHLIAKGIAFGLIEPVVARV